MRSPSIPRRGSVRDGDQQWGGYGSRGGQRAPVYLRDPSLLGLMVQAPWEIGARKRGHPTTRALARYFEKKPCVGAFPAPSSLPAGPTDRRNNSKGLAPTQTLHLLSPQAAGITGAASGAAMPEAPRCLTSFITPSPLPPGAAAETAADFHAGLRKPERVPRA